MSRRHLRIGGVAAVLVATAAALEVGARLVGLGNPPLWLADPEIEYLPKPGNHRRFGKRYSINSRSMRSAELPDRKAPGELRVLFLGDSVVNGWMLVDQSELMTTTIAGRLSAALGRPVTVGNASAGSWGFPNELAYARRFGLAGADLVVVVTSADDASDVPSGRPVVGVDPSYPSRAPVFAAGEVATRAFVRFVFRVMRWPLPSDQPAETPATLRRAQDSLARLISLGREHGVPVLVAMHWRRDELEGGPFPGHRTIVGTAQEAGARVVELDAALRAAVRRGERPYQDVIHLTATGQRALAEALEGPVTAVLRERAGAVVTP